VAEAGTGDFRGFGGRRHSLAMRADIPQFGGDVIEAAVSMCDSGAFDFGIRGSVF
jgi:hypothetical protein